MCPADRNGRLQKRIMFSWPKCVSAVYQIAIAPPFDVASCSTWQAPKHTISPYMQISLRTLRPLSMQSPVNTAVDLCRRVEFSRVWRDIFRRSIVPTGFSRFRQSIARELAAHLQLRPGPQHVFRHFEPLGCKFHDVRHDFRKICGLDPSVFPGSNCIHPLPPASDNQYSK